MKIKLTISLILSLFLSANVSISEEWRFNAFLDGDEIGQHSFIKTETENAIKLASRAEFKVKILFITAYSYLHQADEVWNKNCLDQLNSTTKEKGKTINVSAKKENGNLKVINPKGTETIETCAMTFAYWNPIMLEQKKLLNPQTGEWLDVNIQLKGEEVLDVRGTSVKASHYLLTAKNMQIDLWYKVSSDMQKQEWLALKSTTPEGYVIEYKLV